MRLVSFTSSSTHLICPLRFQNKRQSWRNARHQSTPTRGTGSDNPASAHHSGSSRSVTSVSTIPVSPHRPSQKPSVLIDPYRSAETQRSMFTPGYINCGYLGSLPTISSGRQWHSAATKVPWEIGDSPFSFTRVTADQRLMRWLDAQSWHDLHTLETVSDECLPKLQSLLGCPSKIAIARSFQGSEANALIDFLDRVSALCASCPSNLTYQPQVLVQLSLDGKHQQRCLRLLSKICKTQGVVPTSYILQQEFIRVGSVQDRGGFSEVSNGEYLGNPVAIKDLKANNGDFNRTFKVCLISPCVIIAELPLAVLSRNYWLETSIPPEYPASIGCFCVKRTAPIPHPL